MSFISSDTIHSLPEEMNGIYLLPYAWLECGLKHGHIVVEDLNFYDTVQGSMLLFLRNSKAIHTVTSSGITRDVWYMFKSGDNVIKRTIPVDDEGRLDSRPAFERKTVFDKYSKIHGIISCDVLELANMSAVEQRTVNKSLIQLFKGCSLKLARTVWFMPKEVT